MKKGGIQISGSGGPETLGGGIISTIKNHPVESMLTGIGLVALTGCQVSAQNIPTVTPESSPGPDTSPIRMTEGDPSLVPQDVQLQLREKYSASVNEYYLFTADNKSMEGYSVDSSRSNAAGISFSFYKLDNGKFAASFPDSEQKLHIGEISPVTRMYEDGRVYQALQVTVDDNKGEPQTVDFLILDYGKISQPGLLSLPQADIQNLIYSQIAAGNIENVAVGNPVLNFNNPESKTPFSITWNKKTSSNSAPSWVTSIKSVFGFEVIDAQAKGQGNLLTPTAPVENATPVPVIEVSGITLPDPRISNPELFASGNENMRTVIYDFAKAMEIGTNQDAVIEGLTPVVKTDAGGNKLVFMTTSGLSSANGLDINGVPLLMAHQENGQWVWTDVWTRNLADANNLTLEVPWQTNSEKVANQIFLSGELDASIVFDSFDQSAWRRVISNWDAIKKQLDEGKIPTGFSYNWDRAVQAVEFANANGMTVRSQHLLWGGDVPDSLFNGGFTKDEIKIISEFVVKTRVLKFNGDTQPGLIINQWDIADEWAATAAMPHDKWPFWINALGFPDGLTDVARWTLQANKNAELVVVEDAMLHTPAAETIWRQNYIRMLDFIAGNKIPVSMIDIENNFWVNDPPNMDEMMENLKMLTDRGFKVTSETTVSTANEPVVWMYPQSKVIPSNPDAAQAQIFSDNLTAYLQVNADQFGLGSINDAQEFFGGNARSSMFRADGTPKPSFYIFMKVLFDRLK